MRDFLRDFFWPEFIIVVLIAGFALCVLGIMLSSIQEAAFSKVERIGSGEVLYTSYSPREVSSGVGVGITSSGDTAVMPITMTKSEKLEIIVRMKDGTVLNTDTDMATLFSVSIGDYVSVYKKIGKIVPIEYCCISALK